MTVDPFIVIDLPKRHVVALIEALRIRALALTGETWERSATRDMMKEAAQQLEDLSTEVSRLTAEIEPLQESIRRRAKAYNELSEKHDALLSGLRQLIEESKSGPWVSRVIHSDELSVRLNKEKLND